MPFMKPQITKRVPWYQVETANGTVFIDEYFLNKDPKPADVIEFTEVFEVEDIHDIHLMLGYGARLSAPGYLDCTDWSVWDSFDDAVLHLEEMYDADCTELKEDYERNEER